jgi:hypothetical protein
MRDNAAKKYQFFQGENQMFIDKYYWKRNIQKFCYGAGIQDGDRVLKNVTKLSIY